MSLSRTSNHRILLSTLFLSVLFETIPGTQYVDGQGLLVTPEEDYESIKDYSEDPLAPAIALEAATPLGALEAVTPLAALDASPSLDVRLSASSRSVAAASELPPEFDLSDYVPGPGQQAFNDCVGWAVAYATYSCQLGYSRRRAPTEKCDLFSPAFIYSQIKKGRNGGALLFSRKGPNAVDLVVKKGCASEATMPYDRDLATLDRQPSEAAFEEARNFVAFKHERARNLSQIKRAIYRHHPVILSIQMDERFRNEQDKSIYEWTRTKAKWHAVCAIGYDDKKQALLLINSWGTNWKNGGYCWASYSNFKTIGSHNNQHWCGEAHVIKVGINPLPEFASTTSSDFVLETDHRIQQSGVRISPGSWQISDITCTDANLFALRENGTVYLLRTDARNRQEWINLTNSRLPFGLEGAEVSMVASSRTHAFALTASGVVFKYVVNAAMDRHWVRSGIPEEAKIIDLRGDDGVLRATTDRGMIYSRNRTGEWTRPAFSKN